MAIYAIAIIPLLLMLVDQAEQLPGKRTKLGAYADDFIGAGSINACRSLVCRLGEHFGL